MITSLIISFLLALFNLISEPEFLLEKEYNIKMDYFSSDQFGNVYLINGSDITKIEITNDKKIRYSDKTFGNITSIDASDPFRILIFNKDFNKILFLDNKLSVIASPIFLDNLEFYNVAAVCQSNNGGFWIFDQNLNQLVYLDRNLKIANQSAQMSSFLGPINESTSFFMLEKNDYIYLAISGEGLLLFDSYGTYIKSFPIKEISSFQVVDNTIIYGDKEHLNFYNTQSFKKDKLDLPDKNVVNSRLEGAKLFLQTQDKLQVYRVKNF